MKNITQKIISTILVLALVAGCFAALPLAANAADKPVSGDPAWKADYKNSEHKGKPTPNLYDRGNASGDKIPSNAHSADYPGLYFYWDDKQKDDGVLLVADRVFDLFQEEYTYNLPNVDKKKSGTEITVTGGFILTAKNSNNYWGYVITKDTGEVIDTVNGEDIYAYAIPKQFQYINPNNGKNDKEDLKNINMVFIDGNYKPAKFDIEKHWYDEDGIEVDCSKTIAKLNSDLTFNNQYKLGPNTVKITDYKTAYFGAKITVTENAPKGYFEQNGGSQTIYVKWDTNPTVTFKNQKQWAIIEIAKLWQDVEGNTITDEELLASLKAEFIIKDNRGKVVHKGGPDAYEVKEGTYTVKEIFATAGYELVGDNNVKVTVAAGDKTVVTFENQQITIAMAHVNIIENWIDGTTTLDDSEYFNEDVYGHFNIGDADSYNHIYGNPYVYSSGGFDVDVGEYVVLIEYDLHNEWELISVTINGEDTLISKDYDKNGYQYYTVKFYATEADEYDVVFTNNHNTPPCDAYYVNFISGADFGFPVMDAWTGDYNYPRGITEYWNVWASDGIWHLSAMQEIAARSLEKNGEEKTLDWVWNIEGGITCCPETNVGGPNAIAEWNGEFFIEGSNICDERSGLYFQADNAVAVYINDELVAFTHLTVNNDDLINDGIFTFENDPNSIHDFTIYYVGGAALKPFLHQGVNTIKIVAANELFSEPSSNPCGVLLALEVYSYDAGASDPHVHTYVPVVTPPTCTEDGFTTHTCDCGDEYTDDEIDALGHTAGDAADCTHDQVCTVCGEVIVEALGHIEVSAVSAEVVTQQWNEQTGSDARFDVTIKLTFTVTRGDDVMDEEVFVEAYYRNNNFNKLSETFTVVVECYAVDVTVVLSVDGSNQSAVFSISDAPVVINSAVLVCEL